MFRWPQNGRLRSTKSSNNLFGEVFFATTATSRDSEEIVYFEVVVFLKQQLKHTSSFVTNFLPQGVPGNLFRENAWLLSCSVPRTRTLLHNKLKCYRKTV